MSIYFYQGKTDYFLTKNIKDEEKERIAAVKARIAEFFNMKNVHFLFGSGTSCPATPNMAGLFEIIEDATKGNSLFENIVAKTGENLEEILGVLYSERAYLEGILTADPTLLDNCKNLVSEIEEIIFNKLNVSFALDKGIKVLSTYKTFYQKIALRNKDLSRINVFTTNNDLFNETALDSLNIHYINGFTGGINKYFNPALFNYTYSKRMDTSIDKFEPVENMIYLYKIHGSINWIEEQEDESSNNYFNIKEVYPPLKKGDNNVMIYPTPTKQNKSLGSPYIDLFREFQHKLLEPNGVLFVIGYSFSDEHVNDIIYRALATNSTFNVVIINDIDENKPICKIDDNRIFRIWGEATTGGKETIHYFDYIVKKLLPNLDAFREEDKVLVELMKKYKETK